MVRKAGLPTVDFCNDPGGPQMRGLVKTQDSGLLIVPLKVHIQFLACFFPLNIPNLNKVMELLHNNFSKWFRRG